MKKLSLLLTTVLLLTSCGSASDDTIKIGLIGSMSGEGAEFGILSDRVMTMALEPINAAGGIHGRQLTLIAEDSGGASVAAVTAAQKMINIDKIKIISPTYSSEVLAVAPVANQNQVLLMAGMASSPEVTNAGDYVFRTKASDDLLIKALAERASEYHRIGLLVEQADWSADYADSFTKYYPGEVIRKDYLGGETDFRTLISSLQAAGVDALLLSPHTNGPLDAILKQLAEQRWSVPILSNELILGSTEVVRANAAFYRGQLLHAAFIPPDNPAYQQFIADYQTRYGEALTYPAYAVSTYDAITVLAEALEAVGEDPTALRDYLYKHTFQSHFGYPIQFDSNGDVVSGAIAFYQFDGTDFIPLTD